MSTFIANGARQPMSYHIPVRFSVRKLVLTWTGRQSFFHLIILKTDHCSPRQTSLDGVVTQEPRTPAFTSAGLLDFIIELIVCEDEVSRTSYCMDIVLTCLWHFRHSVWSSAAGFVVSSSFADHRFPRRTFHTANPCGRKYFCVLTLRSKRSARVCVWHPARFLSPSTRGPPQLATPTYLSQRTIYMRPLVTLVRGS